MSLTPKSIALLPKYPAIIALFLMIAMIASMFVLQYGWLLLLSGINDLLNPSFIAKKYADNHVIDINRCQLGMDYCDLAISAYQNYGSYDQNNHLNMAMLFWLSCHEFKGIFLKLWRFYWLVSSYQVGSLPYSAIG